MKAIRFHETGEPTVLQYEDVERPEPGAGQVRLRVAASAFNPADNGMRAGNLPIPITLPHVPGYDVSGTVDAVGADVDGLRIGDGVVGFLPMTDDGGAAEYVLAPADSLVAAPTSIALADAAGIPSVALTAWQALFEQADVKAGQRVLILGAGGPVGGYAVQFAKAAGAHVLATASPRSADSVRAAGADELIDRTTTDVAAAVSEPLDVLLNLAPISPEEFVERVRLVRDGGVVVSTTAWMPAPGDEARDIRGIVVFVRSDASQLAEIVRRVDAGEVRVEIERRIPLRELPALHEQAAAGSVRGKVLVIPDGE